MRYCDQGRWQPASCQAVALTGPRMAVRQGLHPCQELPQQGEDIHDVIRLSPELAKTGGPYAYFHRLLQKKLVVKIPVNVKEGQKIRLADMGREGKGGADPGDLFLTVKIRRPLLEQVKQWVKGRAKPPAV